MKRRQLKFNDELFIFFFDKRFGNNFMILKNFLIA